MNYIPATCQLSVIIKKTLISSKYFFSSDYSRIVGNLINAFNSLLESCLMNFWRGLDPLSSCFFNGIVHIMKALDMMVQSLAVYLLDGYVYPNFSA